MQGRLRDEPLSFEIETECACCRRVIHLTMGRDLDYTVVDDECRPMFFVPAVDFGKLEAPSIIDDF